MDFSIVIPSRNRSDLVRKAISSIMAQDHDSFEIIVVNDGSHPQQEADYQALAREFGAKTRLHTLPRTSRGHGPSFVINTGVELAEGAYVGFLDDDDYWIDTTHLSRCKSVIDQETEEVDVIYCNQEAVYSDGSRVMDKIWLEGLLDNIQPEVVMPDIPAYRVTTGQLMQHSGFAHLNTSIIRRELYLDIGGMDNSIRYEGDRDLYLRTVDSASRIIYMPVTVSRHNVPDPSLNQNESTGVNDMQKALSQLQLLEKACVLAKRKPVRDHGWLFKSYTLKRITEILVREGRYRDAALFAREALASNFTLKWLGYTGWIQLRALIN